VNENHLRMNTSKKVAITFATLIGVAVVGYLGWWAYKKYRTSSGDSVKDNRDIQIVRA